MPSSISNELRMDSHAAKTNDAFIGRCEYQSTTQDTSEGFLSFDVPALSLKSGGDQLDFLLLAWVLFLYRSNGNRNESPFTWGYHENADGNSNTVTQLAAVLSDILSGGTDQIFKNLEAIRSLRQIPRSQSSECQSEKQLMFFAGNDPLDQQNGDANLSFAIEAQISEERLHVRPSQLSPSLSRHMANVYINSFVDVLKTTLSEQDQTLAQAIRVCEHELAQLWQWNGTVPPNIENCMHEYIEEQAKKNPSRLAVVSWDGELSYGELDKLSTQLAVHLAMLGAAVGTIVPLCFEKSMWTVIGVLAIMKAGAGFVLTDPSQPEARLRVIAEEVKAGIVLTSVKQAALGALIVPEGKVIVVGPELRDVPASSKPVNLPKVPGSAILYVIFTSGSTGKPKGVVISHANYTSGAIPRRESVGYKAKSRVLDFASYAFDVSIDCMLCTLSQGGCICVPSDEARVNDLDGAIRSMNVNMAHMTPSVARVLSVDVLPSLDVLGLGGESVSAGDAAAWGEMTQVIIAYGPSECTVGCTINNNIAPGRTYTSIGKGVGGNTWIVDPEDHNTLMTLGAVGELLIEGPIVGVGYINEPEKTSMVFIEDPTWLLAGNENTPGRHGRLYKTGDLVRYDPDGSGSIVFAGRKDRQVKLRGQRVELAEIEHHLRKLLPADASVVAEVITPSGKGREPTLVAFVAEQGDRTPIDDDPIISFSSDLQKVLPGMDKALSTDLPIYMVPAAYIPLREMPLLVSCKVDRKKLQEIGLGLSRQQLATFRIGTVEKHEPKTDMEMKLHKIWLRLFGQDVEIGTKDNFFALGGDSLKAMKLVAATRNEGLSLTVGKIFAGPTISQLASTVKAISSEPEVEIPAFSLLDQDWPVETARIDASKLLELDPASIEDIYPCTPLQEGLMALSAKISEAYVAQRVVDLKSLAAANALKEAFDRVADDCAILRTRVLQVPGRGLMQVVVNEPLSWTSSSSLEKYLARDRGIAMELGEPLVRFAAVDDDTTGKVHVVLTMHHALYDGWCMPLIIDRVNKAYKGLTPEPRTSFKVFIKYLEGQNRSSSESYWADQLNGASFPQFPFLPSPGYQTKSDSLLEHYVAVSKSSSSNITVATAIRAAWALIAAQYTSSQDIVFGETLTGRNAPITGIEQIEGPLITTVPMRIHVNRERKISDYLQDVHDQTVARIPHEHMGLQHIRRLSPDAREACELRTGLVLHPTTEPEDEIKYSEEEPANGFVPANDAEAAKEALKFNSYALMLVCSLDPKGFLIMASFDSNTVNVPQMERILGEFGRTVQNLCEDPTGKIGGLQLLNEKDRADLWRLSSSGPRSISQSGAEVLGGNYTGSAATWIVDPSDPELLLPVGAIGELLIESPDQSYAPLIESPRWLFQGCMDSPGRQTPLYKTGHLAMYNSDGSILFKGQKGEASIVKQLEPNRASKRAEATTPRQRELLNLWSRVLGVEEGEIGLEDSFFDFGGDSIAAMKLVSEARMEGLRLSVAQVFGNRSLAEMAEIIEGSNPTEEVINAYEPFSALDDVSDRDAFISEISPLLARPEWKIADVLPSRPLQDIAVKGTTQLPRYSARYELFYLESGVDRSRLFNSCQALVSRNEILRTVFVRHAEKCFGVVLDDLHVQIEEYAIEGNLKSFTQKLCHLDVQTKMPLGSPFVKFLYVQGEEGKSCLIFKISHAQYDEICLPPLLKQLSALYEDRPVPAAIPFSTFTSHVLKKNIPLAIPYWKDLLTGSSLSTVIPSPPLTTRQAISIYETFDISSRPKEITIATLPTAAWALCLARYLNIRDVTFGEVASGRNIDLPNADTVMGPCWQYIPLRVPFQSHWTVLDLLTFIQNQHIQSTRYEGVGLTEIIKNCTDWQGVDWFDSVVHQDVEHVETLAFMQANSRMDTIYPHLEPLREWKIQAFPKGDTLTLEVVTFEPWKEVAQELLKGLGEAMRQLVNAPDTALFAQEIKGGGVVCDQ
ncbi:peptide synthetase [Amylocarpus encephaloides]|uniref:Peptide synthetase n=1 Tax=Amylocarpus encephaloides TaxID=45428 RepID=A0A9P7YPP9_9HELO|nr:peptide synthetase [Amylocarpus encephaloides]